MPIELEMGLRILMAATLGAIIGYQRERAGKSAGVRTVALVCVGAALFTMALALLLTRPELLLE